MEINNEKKDIDVVDVVEKTKQEDAKNNDSDNSTDVPPLKTDIYYSECAKHGANNLIFHKLPLNDVQFLDLFDKLVK